MNEVRTGYPYELGAENPFAMPLPVIPPCPLCSGEVARDDPAAQALDWGVRVAESTPGASNFWKMMMAAEMYRNIDLRSGPAHSDARDFMDKFVSQGLDAVVESADLRLMVDTPVGFREGDFHYGGAVPRPVVDTAPGGSLGLISMADWGEPVPIGTYERRPYCCLACGVEIEVSEEATKKHKTMCVGTRAVPIVATFKWKWRRQPGEMCKVEWWEFRGTNPRKGKADDRDEFNEPYAKPGTWSEMGNRRWHPAESTLQEKTAGKTWAVIREQWDAGVGKDEGSGAEDALDLKDTPFTDEACLARGDWLWIHVRQRSGCVPGPTHEATIYVEVPKSGGATKTIPPESSSQAIAYPVSEGTEGSPNYAPDDYWKHEPSRAEEDPPRDPWLQRESPFDERCRDADGKVVHGESRYGY